MHCVLVILWPMCCGFFFFLVVGFFFGGGGGMNHIYPPDSITHSLISHAIHLTLWGGGLFTSL
jgi:hypothetical protein